MNCPSCGAAIAAGGTFCGRCDELLIQTRNLAALAGLFKPFFPSQSGSGGSGFSINLGG